MIVAVMVSMSEPAESEAMVLAPELQEVCVGVGGEGGQWGERLLASTCLFLSLCEGRRGGCCAESLSEVEHKVVSLEALRPLEGGRG